MFYLSDLGGEIARLRKERGMTQAELAKASGLGRSTIARLETANIPEFGVRKLMQVLDALGCELDIKDEQRPFTLNDLRKEREGLVKP